MKYISIKGLENKVYVFDEEDNLCPKCSYLRDEGSRQCLSCNIFHAEKNKGFTGGKLYFENIFSVGKYYQKNKSEKPTKKSKDIMTWLILNAKSDEKFIPFCAELIRMKMEEHPPKADLKNENIILCSVPDLDSIKVKKANLLTESISKKIELKFLLLLIKCKETKKQHSFGVGELQKKFENIKDAFKLNDEFKEEIKNKTIFLIDDVVSTMASINECSRILKESGAKEIFIFSLGRNILPDREKK